MKVLFLGDINSPHIKKEAEELTGAAIKLGIFSISRPASDWFISNRIECFYPENIDKMIFSGSLPAKIRFLRLLPEIRHAIRTFKPDLLHAHYASSYGFLAALSFFRPMIISVWGSDINTVRSENSFRNFIVHMLSNLAFLRAKKVIIVSPNLLRNIWWSRRKTCIIPSGINMKTFRPLDKAECRKALNWDEKEKVVLFFANNPVIKRLDIAEATMTRIHARIPDARLHVLDGSLSGGELIPLFINASDCLLICSDSEGSPNMVKEALACNLPVVGTDVGDVAERLKGVEQCRIVPRDPEHLAEAITEILESGKRSGGREKMLADGLSLPQVTMKIRNIYEQYAK